MKVAIVDYGSGNLRSAEKALERAARETGVDCRIAVTGDADKVAAAERIVLPGVGAFRDCRQGLARLDGMWQALDEAARTRAVPILGICVGMQLMATLGLEHGETPGFGWIAGKVVPIAADGVRYKVPHMGWNTLQAAHPHPLFAGIPLGDQGWHAYFVHSYHFAADDRGHMVATTDYGGEITAAVARGNLAGVQFHPEKSQKLGLALLGNFLTWRP